MGKSDTLSSTVCAIARERERNREIKQFFGREILLFIFAKDYYVGSLFYWIKAHHFRQNNSVNKKKENFSMKACNKTNKNLKFIVMFFITVIHLSYDLQKRGRKRESLLVKSE